MVKIDQRRSTAFMGRRGLETKFVSSPHPPAPAQVHLEDRSDNCSSASVLGLPPSPRLTGFLCIISISPRASSRPHVEVVPRAKEMWAALPTFRSLTGPAGVQPCGFVANPKRALCRRDR
jgi:hypothetical protein